MPRARNSKLYLDIESCRGRISAWGGDEVYVGEDGEREYVVLGGGSDGFSGGTRGPLTSQTTLFTAATTTSPSGPGSCCQPSSKAAYKSANA
ncbi:hypothetical protein SUGI_0832900 [Cryptomeria japonica]|nr:hypothetical protein SUGI_0832900 [Cryptomeria japonica]